ncbi:MAG: AraC family transcriptional regulator ligand-binding domain-containing protein [Hyphomonadaceae bacterium]
MQVVRAESLGPVRDVALRLGVDISSRLQVMGLSPEDVERSGKYVAWRPAINLCEDCAKLCRAPDFGLQVGEYQDISIIGPAALAAVHAPTARVAMETATRNMHLANVLWRVTYSPLSELRATFLALAPTFRRTPPAVQSVERSMAFMHKVLRLFAGGAYTPMEVWFAHGPIAPLTAYRAVFGVTPQFSMPADGIVISDAQFDAVVPERSERLFQLAQSVIEREFPCPENDLQAQVTVLCERALLAGDGSQRAVASMLGMHERTLQRRLQSEGVTFEQIKDAARRDLAERYLSQRDVAVSSISEMLGYAEPSAFSRSCRRWFGETPRALRARLAQGV